MSNILKLRLGLYFNIIASQSVIQSFEAPDGPLPALVIPGQVGGHIGEPNLLCRIPEVKRAPIADPAIHSTRHRVNQVSSVSLLINRSLVTTSILCWVVTSGKMVHPTLQ